MTKRRHQYPTADAILVSLTDLINKVEEINISENEHFVKETANKMLAELKAQQEELKKYVAATKQYDPFHSHEVLSNIFNIVKSHKTDLEAAPGFWNKVAYCINDFFGAEIFHVTKTEFSKDNDEKATSFKHYKEEIKDMKECATFDSVAATLGF